LNSIRLFPNKQRGTVAVVLLSTMLVLQFIFNIRTYYLKSNLGNRYTVQELHAIKLDMINGVISLILFVVYIITIVFFLRWFKRAYQNAAELGVKLRYSTNMSVGAWFIPLFHWIGPVQMMLELYRNTEKILIENSLTRKKKIRYILIFAWWFIYILCGIIALIDTIFILPRSDRLELAIWMADYLLFVNLLNFGLTILAIAVVNNYRKLEIKLNALSYVTENKDNRNVETIDEGLIS